jgi:hypothetical protein
MTMMLHAMLYAVLALGGWIALVLSVGALINGRAWVWERTREVIAQLVWSLRHPRGALLTVVRVERDQPMVLLPRRSTVRRRSTI